MTNAIPSSTPQPEYSQQQYAEILKQGYGLTVRPADLANVSQNVLAVLGGTHQPKPTTSSGLSVKPTLVAPKAGMSPGEQDPAALILLVMHMRGENFAEQLKSASGVIDANNKRSQAIRAERAEQFEEQQKAMQEAQAAAEKSGILGIVGNVFSAITGAISGIAIAAAVIVAVATLGAGAAVSTTLLAVGAVAVIGGTAAGVSTAVSAGVGTGKGVVDIQGAQAKYEADKLAAADKKFEGLLAEFRMTQEEETKLIKAILASKNKMIQIVSDSLKDISQADLKAADTV